LVALAIAVILAACGDGPTRPSGGNNPPPPPPPPPSPVLLGLQIDGPASVPPGETAQFTATGTYTDGSTRNLTSETGIVWRSFNTRILNISASGVATGGDRGETTVTVGFGGRTAVKSGVLVLPAGTYRLSGTVTDTGIPINGARVEVTHGPATGQVTTSTPGYRIYGVAGDTEIRVQRDGYRDERRRIQIAAHTTTDIEMTPSAPRENVEGTYTLTVTAGDQCGGVPAEVRERRFTASLRQQGPQVTVTLEGSTFLISGGRTFNSFSGRLEGDRLSFFLQEPYTYYFYYYLPDVMELLTPNTYFFMGGGATTNPSGNSRSGTLSGLIGTMEGPTRFRQLSSCRSSGHRFDLARR
jgi:hypothetical protein